jgi:hypothetical protein
MTESTSTNWVRGIVFWIGLLVVLMSVFEAASHADAPGASGSSPLANFIALNMKFEGSMTCSDPNCHGQAAPERGILPNTEYSIWSQKDQHSKAFAALQAAKGAGIGTKLGIADVTTSSKCLSCHAVDAVAALQGQQFNVTEGVSCDACHGPSEKWIGPHSKKVGDDSWADAQRKTSTPAIMLQTFGFNDLKSPFARAENCTKCHLAIDASLIDAGHPQPAFEIDQYSLREPKHWIDPKGYYNVKLWSVGQIVCLDESVNQLAQRAGGGASPDRVKEAYYQAASHANLVAALIANNVITGDVAAFNGHLQAMAAAANKQPADIQTEQHEAAALAGIAESLFPTADKVDPDKQATLAMLKQIAGNADLSKNLARRGAEQQEFALYWLYYSYAAAENIPADGDTVKPLLKSLFKIVKFADQTPITSEELDQFAQIVSKISAALSAL